MKPATALVLFASLFAAACAPSTSQIEATVAESVARTQAAQKAPSPTPGEAKPPPSATKPSPTSIPTRTRLPTYTPRPTLTPRPTQTPTETLPPRIASQTAQALTYQATQTAVRAAVEATRDFKQLLADIKNQCKPIDWQELSETEYAREHEGECVYVKGEVWQVNFAEDLISIQTGWYSAEVIVGVGRLDNRTGRIVENGWVSAWGTVCTTCWISTNRLDGSETPAPGIQARLIEGAGILWVDEY